MKRLTILSTALLSASAIFALELNVTPGSLASKLPDIDSSATSLYLIGKIDARDLAAFDHIPDNIKILGMGDVRIVGFTGKIDEFPDRSIFPADYMPDHLLFNSGFESITLPRNTRLGKGICANSPALTSVTVSEGTTQIPDYAFYGCPALTSVTLPQSITALGRSSFENCTSLETLDLSATSLTSIPDRCMAADPALKSVAFPNGITSIGSEILTGSSVESVSLPSLMKAAPYALSGMDALTNVVLNPECDIELGMLMNNHSLTSVSGTPSDIPPLYLADSPAVEADKVISGATSIGSYAFSRAAFNRLLLPAGLAYLDKGILAYAASLSEIDASALNTNVPDLHPEAFSGINPEEITLRVAVGCADPWKNHPLWSLFKIVDKESNVGEIAEASSDIRFAVVADILSVTSSEPIEKVQAWLPSGVKILDVAPQTRAFEVSLTLPPSERIIILRAATSSASRSASILMK